MKIGAWNVEGLSEGKQGAMLDIASELDLDAAVLYETWIRPGVGLPPPTHALWHRFDLVCSALHPEAPRGKAGISLLAKLSLRVSLFRYCPDFRWAIWTTTGPTIVGVYIPPSVALPEYQRTLDDLTVALAEAHAARPRPLIVVGDFNARLGNVVGDHVTNSRKNATLAFLAEAQMELLNCRQLRNPRRYTWRSPGCMSVVDLAMVRGSPCSSFFVGSPPVPTPHRLLVIDVAHSVDEVILDPSRWAWARSAFSSPEKAELCGTLLAPTMDSLAGLWRFVADTLDAQLPCGNRDPQASTADAQELVDAAYSAMCRAVRCSVLGLACWNPERSRRGHQVQPRIDWKELAGTGDGFFLSSVKFALQSAGAAGPANGQTGPTPNVAQFASVYKELFAAGPDTPAEPHLQCRRRICDVSDDEAEYFSEDAMLGLLRRAKWKKAIGPDNIPADAFKCCAKRSAQVLNMMFMVFWAHQIMPSAWRTAFVVPIEKKGADLNDPSQWRGIALQSHLKKLFEVAIRRMCRDKEWTKVHVLQTGFQPATGAIEAVYAVDELTRKYAAMDQPLSLALLDVRKAYDRTPRAFIFRKLRRRGMPEHVIGVIQALLDSCQVILRVGNDRSDPVAVEVGVPQGDVLSPDMFNVFVDDLAERLVTTCSGFGGCPRYGNVDIPLVMYADDQTIMHWRPDALQAMLLEAEKYAAEHQYTYNVNKCVVSHPTQNEGWPALLMNCTAIPVSASTSLLGVKITNGLVDHTAQLADRLEKGKRAIAGLEMLGAFRTPYLSAARKRLMLNAYGRSRAEYGLAVAPHTKAALKKVDSWMMEMTAKCLGGGRGSALTMRLCGIIPAHPRMAQLRMRFIAGLRAQSRRPAPEQSLATRVYAKAVAPPDRRRYRNSSTRREPPSVYRRLVRYMPIIDTADELTRKYAQEFEQLFERAPSEGELSAIERRASGVALRKLAWDDRERRLKLLPLQQQDFSVPHPVAYLAGDTGDVPGRWLTNLLPGNGVVGKPCTKCDGDFPVSRYHITRCADSVACLGRCYCPIAHATFFFKVDNPVDAMIMDLVPRPDRAETILNQLDKCPFRPKAQRPTGAAPTEIVPVRVPVADPVRPWRDALWVAQTAGIASAISEMRRQCCPQAEPAPRAALSRSRTWTHPDRRQSDDRSVPSQAFPPPIHRAVGVFTAGNRCASPPILPPAR